MPDEKRFVLKQADPTWHLEYEFFKNLVETGAICNLDRDIWLNSTLSNMCSEIISGRKMKNNKTTVGFLGLTHLGVNTAVALASKGFSTVWFAEEQEQVNRLELGQLGVVEPDLDDFFSFYRDKISITANKADLKECDIVYISPDVSTNDEGLSDLSLINDLLDSSIDHLASSAVLVVLSQVPPGFTRNISYPKNQLFIRLKH